MSNTTDRLYWLPAKMKALNFLLKADTPGWVDRFEIIDRDYVYAVVVDMGRMALERRQRGEYLPLVDVISDAQPLTAAALDVLFQLIGWGHLLESPNLHPDRWAVAPPDAG